MNRRSFFTKLGLGAATVAVLPSATTYVRRWVKTGSGLFIESPVFDPMTYTGQWKFVGVDLGAQVDYSVKAIVMAPVTDEAGKVRWKFSGEVYRASDMPGGAV